MFCSMGSQVARGHSHMTSAKFWDPPHQRVEDPNLSSLTFPCLWNHQYTSFNELLCLEKDGKCYHYSEVGFVCRRADLLSASSWSRLAPWRGLCCRRTQPRQAGRLAGWEISIDSRRQKLAILLNVRVRTVGQPEGVHSCKFQIGCD